MNPLRYGKNYLARGWSIIPVMYREKKPLVPWKEFQTRCCSEDEFREWLKAYPMANIGIVTGQVSNLVVLDVDGAEGLQSLVGYALPQTLAVQTRRGIQYYFQHPGFVVRNFVNKRPGLDIRGDGGFAVAPPSVHPSGHVYTWLNDCAVAPMPDWLIRWVKPRPVRHVSVPIHGDAYQLMRGEIERLVQAPEGSRNNALNIAAFRLGMLVARGLLNRWAVEDILTSIAQSKGLSSREIAATIRSGLEAGMRR